MSQQRAPAPSPAPMVALNGARGERQTAQSVEAWIAEARRDEDKDGPLTMIFLAHEPSGREIHHCKLGGSPGKSDSELAGLFLGKAKSYAEGLPGVQTFQLKAFYGTCTEPQAFKPFTMGGRTEFDGLMTEDPSARGALAQGMRLSEMLVQGSFHTISAMFSNMQTMHESMLRENQDLRADNRTTFQMVLQLLTEQAKMRHDKTMEELRYARSTEERALWIKFAPPLINTIVGKEVFPASVADTALIEGIAEHLSDEHLKALAASNMFPPELWGPLSARLTDIVKKKQHQEAQLQKAVASATPELTMESEEGGNA